MKEEILSNFSELKKNSNTSIDEHIKYAGWDGTIYNITSVLAIVLASLSALLPPGIDIFYLKLFSGIDAILITVDRALSWGERWIYHRQLRHEYLNTLSRISFYENLPENFTVEEKKDHYMRIYSELFSTRLKEAGMPGVKKSHEK